MFFWLGSEQQYEQVLVKASASSRPTGGGVVRPNRQMGQRNGLMGVIKRSLMRRGRVFLAFFFFINYFPCSFIVAFSSSSLRRDWLNH